MIDKETFIDTINFLETIVKQPEKDSIKTLMIHNFFKLLPLCFSNSEDAKNEIEHYCFNINFGKPSPDSEYTTPGELYEKLT